MKKYKDLTNVIFGKWKVLHYDDIKSKNKKPYYVCECQCSLHTIKLVLLESLKNGKSKSCGCLQKEKLINNNIARKKYNQYNLSGVYGIGYILTGEEFYFDLEDYDKIKDCYWMLTDKGYIRSSVRTKGTFLHQNILNFPFGVIDHINHNTLDNRKINLRITTYQLNRCNSKLNKNNSSKTTGVKWEKDREKWAAYITLKYKTIRLGSFNDINDAIIARKNAEEKFFKEFSYENSMKLAKENIIK
jgi:hypothetical protein